MPSLRHTLLYPLVVCVISLVLFNAALYGLLPPVQAMPMLAPATSFRLEFDRGLINTQGLNRMERQGDISYQWTNASPVSLTFPLEQTGDMVVEFALLKVIEDEMYAHIELRVNDQIISLNREGKHYQGVIPASVLKPDEDTTLVFYTLPPLRLSDLDVQSRDSRLLGVAFDWLELRPANPLTT